MGGRVIQIQIHRQPQLQVTIRLISKTQEGPGQILKFLAKALILLRHSEHIGCLKAVSISGPRHQRSPTASAKKPPSSIIMRGNRSAWHRKNKHINVRGMKVFIVGTQVRRIAEGFRNKLTSISPA